MTAGSYYRFKYRAQNERGFSLFSDILTVGLGPLPTKPTGLSRASIGNNITTIAIDWDDLTTEILEVTYYSLYVDDGQGVIFNKAYKGSLPNAVVSGLTSGVEYSFYVTATNFNGEGTPSDTMRLKSCVVPSGVQAPKLLYTTA